MVQPQIIYTVKDDSGDEGTTTINIPTGFDLSQLTEFGAGMATLLDAILSGKVLTADFCVSVDISSLTSNTALSTSDVEEIGNFQFRTVGNFPVFVNVPTIDELTVLSSQDDLDQADPAVAAFIAAMETGIAVTAGTISPCDVGEDDIALTVYARERFRASGKRK